jgi:hypothetical protein
MKGGGDFQYWPLADIASVTTDVRSRLQSGHR